MPVTANGNKTTDHITRYAIETVLDTSSLPSAEARQSSTRWVRGRKFAIPCAQAGKLLSGKKVPEKRNIGVINRKIGKLSVSIVGTTAVQTMPTHAKAKPPRKATGSSSKA